MCLLDKPSPKYEHPLPHKLPGEMFSMTEQCRLVYGKGSSYCPFIKQCDRIWCTRNVKGRNTCRTNNMPWADGTQCGSDRWCIHGKCVKRERKKPIDGAWGPWGEYEACSRSCGGGISFASRECDNPRPENGGNYCIGPRRKYKSCNTQNCEKVTATFRSLQCAAFNGKDVGIPGVPQTAKWLPRYNAGVKEEDSCKLFCELGGYDGIFYELASKVIDGTKCRIGEDNICVDGRCRQAGCDNILNSKAKLDSCGVCNGDNSTCRKYSGYLNKTKEGYNFVVHVPRGASQLHVIQRSTKNGPDFNFLALLNQRRKYIFNGQWRVASGMQKFKTAGVDVFYSGVRVKDETIWIPGTIENSVEIRVLSLAKQAKANIEYYYNFPIRGEQNYTWRIQNDWSECFPLCQGQQMKEYECRRDIDSQWVSEQKCSGTKPPPKIRKCNRNCLLRWNTFQSECKPLNKCGIGLMEQKVTCIMQYIGKSIEASTLDWEEEGANEDRLMHHTDCRKAGIGRKPKSELPCYAPCTRVRWQYTPWGNCNRTCDGGVQTRHAKCIDQDSLATLPDKDCATIKQGPVQRPCNTNPCPKWYTDAWSGVCSVTCGKGVVVRLVYCVSANKRVADDQCDMTTKPAETQPCQLSSCATWKARAWSKCSKTCGIGYRIRQVHCETGAGEIVNDNSCVAEDKPNEQKKCLEKPCQLNAKIIKQNAADNVGGIRWLVGSWESCSASCGGGIRKRAVACMAHTIMLSEEKCGKEEKPHSQELCNTFSCPFWRHGQWTECTELCGGGTKTRLVACGYNGTIVEDSVCDSSDKPMSKMDCNEKACPTQFTRSPGQREKYGNWKLGQWSECSVSCGPGFKRRNVSCTLSNGETCVEKFKPATTIPCNGGPCPGWNYGQWAPCFTEKKCGPGWQARLVVCQLSDGSVLADSACDAQFRPVSNRTCNLAACPEDARWVTTPWQPCNVPCGEGKQFRYVTCELGNGLGVREERCNAFEEKPEDQKVCRRGTCSKWITGAWSVCDSSCRQTRDVTCQKGTADSGCNLGTKPREEQECESENCVRGPIYMWKVDQWSPCGKTCGYSQKTRRVSCINERVEEVNISYCKQDSGPEPPKFQRCFEGACPSKWLWEAWSECSKSCGPGEQSRRIYCEDEINAQQQVQSSGCLQQERPEGVRPCNLGACDNTYRWSISAWTECTKTCGIGETRRDVFCVDGSNQTQSSSKCPENMPPNYKVCNIHPCPARSCRDVRRNTGIHYDGEHKLLVPGGDMLEVYCEGMSRNNPREFITLKADPKDNYSEIYGKRLRKWNTCPNRGRRLEKCDDCIDYAASGLTFFKKVRIDIRRMVLIPEDQTFSDRFGSIPPGFATAGDCYSSAQCPQGRFKMNLIGTGLQLGPNVTWTSRGYDTSQQIRIMEDRQTVYGKCGGYCGMCAPSYRHGLKVIIKKER